MSTSATQRLITVALLTGAVLVGAAGSGLGPAIPFATVTAGAQDCPPADPNQPPPDPNQPPVDCQSPDATSSTVDGVFLYDEPYLMPTGQVPESVLGLELMASLHRATCAAERERAVHRQRHCASRDSRGAGK